MRAKRRPGRLKPCKACEKPFWCYASRDVGGTLEEKKFCSNACAYANRRSDKGIQERFWSYVRKTDGCWLYERTLDKDGYGYFRIGWNPLRQWFAHRFSWTLAHGDVPAEMCVCHTCDVRNCVNPAHLFLGTHTENMRDMIRKERNPKHTLKPDQVRRVRELLAEGKLNQREIAKMFNVKHGVISDINVGHTYQYVEPSPFAARMPSSTEGK